MLKHSILCIAFILTASLAYSQRNPDSDSLKPGTIHIKKVKPVDSVAYYRNLRSNGGIQYSPLSYLFKLTFCGKDSGQLTKAELKKCKSIDIAGRGYIYTYGKIDDNSGEWVDTRVFSFDLTIRHKKVYMTEHSKTSLLTADMLASLKNVTPGDSIIIKNVQYKDPKSGMQKFDSISFIIVDKETPYKKQVADSIKSK